MISFQVSSGNILPPLVSPWLLSLTWLPLALTLCNPRIQHIWPKEYYLRWGGFHQSQSGRLPKLPSLVPTEAHPPFPSRSASMLRPSLGNGTFQWQFLFVVGRTDWSILQFTWLKTQSGNLCTLEMCFLGVHEGQKDFSKQTDIRRERYIVPSC